MTTYSYPSGIRKPQSVSWKLKSKSAVFSSPLSAAVQTLARPGSVWEFTVQYKNLEASDAHDLDGFLAGIDGREHRFTMSNLAESNQGSVSSCTVNGGSQTGSSLAVTLSGTIAAGDWFSVNGELKQARASLSGSGTLYFKPALYSSPSNGATVTTTDGTGKFMLESYQTSAKSLPNRLWDITFTAVGDPS